MNIGIIGCGKIAQVRHIPEYDANPDCCLKGFFDLAADRAAAMTEKYGGKAYATVEELIADKEIDAVSICAANNAHAKLAIQAMQAGKDVLCEKPMGISLAECEEMLRVSESTGKRLLIGQNQRFNETHLKAKELLEEGVIGKVITFRTTFGHCGPETWSITPGNNIWFFDKKLAAMGAMADLGVHKTDAIRFMLGQDVIRVMARLVTLDKRGADGALIGVDDNAICIYEMSDGAIGTMTASWTYYGDEDNSTIFYGSKGIMRIFDDPEHSIVVVKPDGSRENFDVGTIQTNDNQTKSGVIDEFAASLKEKRESVLDAVNIIGSMKAVFAGIQSSDEGRPVDIQ